MYVKTSNGQVETYPYSIGQLRKDNPHTSFPKNPSDQTLAEWGVYPVTDIPMPSVDHTKNVTEGTPVQVNGAWLRNWVVTDASAEEIAQREADAWANLREKRNQRLTETDYVVLQELEKAIKDNLGVQVPVVWLDYRQALRDLPANTPDPRTPVWPSKPSEGV